MTRDELYGAIRSLEDVINTLNYKFDEGIDRDDPDEVVEFDIPTQIALDQLQMTTDALFLGLY